eukprot:10637688-Ditylum_brightwellii.AAC.1
MENDNTRRTTLVASAGPVYGKTTSFRVEAYRVLSVVCFISRMMECTKMELTWQINSYLVNEGVIIQYH